MARQMQYRQANPWDAVAMVALWDSGKRRVRRRNMIIKSIKTTGLSFAIAAAFLVAVGGSSASAQVPKRFDHDRDGRVDTRRERIEERKGFNDGLVAGRRDALSHRRFNPVVTHRRFVSNDYREGFRQGYAQAYRQFAKKHGYRHGFGY
jgi:hypothetical protein